MTRMESDNETMELCGFQIVRRNTDGTVRITPCARKKGHKDEHHRDREDMAAYAEKRRKAYKANPTRRQQAIAAATAYRNRQKGAE